LPVHGCSLLGNLPRRRRDVVADIVIGTCSSRCSDRHRHACITSTTAPPAPNDQQRRTQQLALPRPPTTDLCLLTFGCRSRCSDRNGVVADVISASAVGEKKKTRCYAPVAGWRAQGPLRSIKCDAVGCLRGCNSYENQGVIPAWRRASGLHNH